MQRTWLQVSHATRSPLLLDALARVSISPYSGGCGCGCMHWHVFRSHPTEAAAAACTRLGFDPTTLWRLLELIRHPAPWQHACRRNVNYRAPPSGVAHSCQPTVKLHILPLVWIFPLLKGEYGGAWGQQLKSASRHNHSRAIGTTPHADPMLTPCRPHAPAQAESKSQTRWGLPSAQQCSSPGSRPRGCTSTGVTSA